MENVLITDMISVTSPVIANIEDGLITGTNAGSATVQGMSITVSDASAEVVALYVTVLNAGSVISNNCITNHLKSKNAI